MEERYGPKTWVKKNKTAKSKRKWIKSNELLRRKASPKKVNKRQLVKENWRNGAKRVTFTIEIVDNLVESESCLLIFREYG